MPRRITEPFITNIIYGYSHNPSGQKACHYAHQEVISEILKHIHGGICSNHNYLTISKGNHSHNSHNDRVADCEKCINSPLAQTID